MHLVKDPAIWLKEIFIDAGLSSSLSIAFSTLGLVIIVLILSWFSNLVAKAIILKIVTRIVRKTTSTWDDIFLEQKVFTRLSHFAPALVIWFMAGWAIKTYPLWLIIIHKLTYLYMVGIGTTVLISFVEAWHQIYKTLPISQHRNIKGYVQLVQIFIVLVALLIVVSVIFKKDISFNSCRSWRNGCGTYPGIQGYSSGFGCKYPASADKMLKVGDWINNSEEGG